MVRFLCFFAMRTLKVYFLSTFHVFTNLVLSKLCDAGTDIKTIFQLNNLSRERLFSQVVSQAGQVVGPEFVFI